MISILMLAAATPVAVSDVTIYDNAKVWTGAGFAHRTLAVANGRFVKARRRDRGVRRVDLRGGFVLPGYGNAHSHITNANAKDASEYLRQGVFYVWNPNTVTMSPATLAFFGKPDTYDLKVAQGGITEPGGHPEKLYVEYLSQYVYTGKGRDWFVGNAFHYGETPAQIDAALDRLVEQRASFVKAYLLHSEEWATRRRNPQFYGQTGLNPANMPYLVAAARKRGLPVAVHVETAHDARVAAEAGVAMLAHMPGYHGETKGGATRLSETDARLLARRDVVVVPTAVVALNNETPSAPEVAAAAELQRHNLRLLRQAGVRLLVGTDGFGGATEEVRRWVAIGALTPLQSVQAMAATGPWLFPERRIGCFDAGCEADFLVLDGDPIRDVANLDRIRTRVKGGRVFEPAG